MDGDRKTEAAEAAEYALSELLKNSDGLASSFRADWRAESLHYEIAGLLEGIADGIIRTGQSRLREAAHELVAAIQVWPLERSSDALVDTPLDSYYRTLRTILARCGGTGLGIAGLELDPSMRNRRGISSADR